MRGAPAAARRYTNRPMLTTVQQHILQQQQRLSPDAVGAFSWLLSGITLATKLIQARVRRAGLLGALGAAGQINIQGEAQQKLDVYANETLLRSLGVRDGVAMVVTEENEEPVTFDRAPETGRYIVVFDPLDGSSNIDVNVNTGTIFAIYRRPYASRTILQPGSKQVAAGYVIYGSSTILVYTTGHGVFGFTLDPGIGEYILTYEQMRMPEHGEYYSVNEGHAAGFPDAYREYLERLRTGALGREYSSRYIGSLVADFHRTLLKGGIFLYPPTRRHAQGKLRLLYEANPLAFIAEQAGGFASNGQERILDIEPHDIHQRTPLAIGGRIEMEEFARVVGANSGVSDDARQLRLTPGGNSD
jgi:fructose-1,6-bisphosphatase I